MASKIEHRSHPGSEYTDLSVGLRWNLYNYVYAINLNSAKKKIVVYVKLWYLFLKLRLTADSVTIIQHNVYLKCVLTFSETGHKTSCLWKYSGAW